MPDDTTDQPPALVSLPERFRPHVPQPVVGDARLTVSGIETWTGTAWEVTHRRPTPDDLAPYAVPGAPGCYTFTLPADITVPGEYRLTVDHRLEVRDGGNWVPFTAAVPEPPPAAVRAVTAAYVALPDELETASGPGGSVRYAAGPPEPTQAGRPLLEHLKPAGLTDLNYSHPADRLRALEEELAGVVKLRQDLADARAQVDRLQRAQGQHTCSPTPDAYEAACEALDGYRRKAGAAFTVVMALRAMLPDLNWMCRYHGDDFDKLGREPDGAPRCDSCKPAWRVARAHAALRTYDAEAGR